MNDKIFKTSKFLSCRKNRIYKTFTTDEYGSWEYSKTNNSGYCSVQPNTLWSRYFVTNGVAFYGAVTSKRTIDNLRYAKSIGFTYKTYRYVENVSNWGGGWVSHLTLMNEFIKFRNTKSSHALTINENVICNLSENVEYNILIKQTCIYINETKYNYPTGLSLFKAQGDECVGYCSMGYVTAIPYAGAYIYLKISNFNVIW